MILVLGTYFFPVNVLSKKKRVMSHRMRKIRGLKVTRYTACLIYLNEYLAVLPGAKISLKNCVTEINENPLNVMLYIYSNQACLQGFNREYFTLKSAVNMFECT